MPLPSGIQDPLCLTRKVSACRKSQRQSLNHFQGVKKALTFPERCNRSCRAGIQPTYATYLGNSMLCRHRYYSAGTHSSVAEISVMLDQGSSKATSPWLVKQASTLLPSAHNYFQAWYSRTWSLMASSLLERLQKSWRGELGDCMTYLLTFAVTSDRKHGLKKSTRQQCHPLI